MDSLDVNAKDMFDKTPIWWVVEQYNTGYNKETATVIELMLPRGLSLFCGHTTSVATRESLSLLEAIPEWDNEFDVDQLVYTAVMYPAPLPPSTNMVPTFFSKLCFCLAGWDDTDVLKVILSDLCKEVRDRRASVASTKLIVAILGDVSPHFFSRNSEFVYATVLGIHSKVKRLRDHIRSKTSEVSGLKPLCIHSVRNRCKHIAKGRSIIPTIRQLECTVPKSIVHDLLLIDEFRGWNYVTFFYYIMGTWYNYESPMMM